MRIRLAGVGDLVAAEGKYHLKCLTNFKRECKISATDTENHHVMVDLNHHLEQGLSQGHVNDMGEVWKNYIKRKQELGQEIPRRYASRND